MKNLVCVRRWTNGVDTVFKLLTIVFSALMG